MADNMTDKQFEKILKMVEMILDGCKDLFFCCLFFFFLAVFVKVLLLL